MFNKIINSFKAIDFKKTIILGISIFLLLASAFLASLTGAYKLGFIEEPINIAGTGSMYPTFPKGNNKTPKEQSRELVATPGMIPYPTGFVIFGKRYFGYELQRQDIISFQNNKIKEITAKTYGSPSGLVKRVIALPGDTVEIKGGLVFVNGKPQKEPFSAKARSTFGGEFLPDCTKLKIPEGKVFVMGDNRKASSDSRYEIGLVDLKDIDHIIPINKQIGVLDKNWRNTSNDFSDSAKIKIDKIKYLELLNQKRKEAGVKLLRYEPKLELSAANRGETILKYDDLSFEATRSGYTVKQAMQDANYSNIVIGESRILGYYEVEELLENAFEFAQSRKFLTDKDYEEFGISEVEGQLNNCPTQIIVLHFAGYVPPNYSQETIESWRKNLANLKEVQPSWNELKSYEEFYNKNKESIDRINEIIALRISRVEAILEKMETNQWLSEEETRYVKEEKNLDDEQTNLANKLNNR